jgi:hypothetical protein
MKPQMIIKNKMELTKKRLRPISPSTFPEKRKIAGK